MNGIATQSPAGEDKGGGIEQSAQKLRRRRISLWLRLNNLNV
jgi:hypothetical protein